MKLRHLVPFTEALVILAVTAMVVHVWHQSNVNSQIISDHYEHVDSIVAANARDVAHELLQRSDSIARDIRERCGPMAMEECCETKESC